LKAQFFLIHIDDTQMPRWCELSFLEDNSSVWIDMKGRRIPRKDGRALAHVEGDNITDAMTRVPPDVAKLEKELAFRFLLDPWSDQGWVTTEGRFYGCRFYAHDEIAYSLIQKSPYALEAAGWLRVHTDSFRLGELTRFKMTPRQQRTILELGFEEAAPGARRVPAFAIDRDAPAPSYAIKPPARSADITVADFFPPPVAAEAAPPTIDLSGILNVLATHPDLGSVFEGRVEEIPEVGPGIWEWMLRFDNFDVGSDVLPEDILSEPGIHLMATSFDTIEVAPWPFSGFHVDRDAEDILKRELVRSSVKNAA
jgi:hypothetical protein